MIALEDKFYHDEYDLAESYDLDELLEDPEDWSIKVELCDLELIGFLDGSVISERAFDEGRFTEEMHDDQEKIAKILNDNIDFEKINSLLPKFWYPNGKYETYTKQDIINLLKENS